MIIICGYGETGKSAGRYLSSINHDFVVVDLDERAFDGEEVTKVVGDATKEHVLDSSGITKAESLIVCTDDDSTNAFIILIAKDLNKELTILSAAEKLESVEKLYRAGADYVMPRLVLTGRMLSKYAIAPYVAEFMSHVALTKTVELAEIQLPTDSAFSNKTLRDARIREQTGATVIAIKRNEEYIPNPSGDVTLRDGDSLIVMGDATQLKRFSAAAGDKPLESPYME